MGYRGSENRCRGGTRRLRADCSSEFLAEEGGRRRGDDFGDLAIMEIPAAYAAAFVRGRRSRTQDQRSLDQEWRAATCRHRDRSGRGVVSDHLAPPPSQDEVLANLTRDARRGPLAAVEHVALMPER